MAFTDLIGKAKELTGEAAAAAGKFMDEFNEALPTMRALGFTIKDLKVGMGIMPEIGAKLIASADSIDPKKIKELIAKYPDNKTLTAALKGLETAYSIKELIGDLPCKGVELDVTLGIPPHVGVAFVSNAPASASAGHAAIAASGGTAD